MLFLSGELLFFFFFLLFLFICFLLGKGKRDGSSIYYNSKSCAGFHINI